MLIIGTGYIVNNLWLYQVRCMKVEKFNWPLVQNFILPRRLNRLQRLRNYFDEGIEIYSQSRASLFMLLFSSVKLML